MEWLKHIDMKPSTFLLRGQELYNMLNSARKWTVKPVGLKGLPLKQLFPVLWSQAHNRPICLRTIMRMNCKVTQIHTVNCAW